MTYAEEPKTDLTGYDAFKAGDKVKLNDGCLSAYCGVDHLRGKEGEVVDISRRVVKKSAFDEKAVLHMYVEKYGVKDEYDVVGLLVKFDEVKLLVSPFGVEKAV